MLRSMVLAVAAFAACIKAEDPTTTSESAPTKTEEGNGPATHTVKVGYPGFDFTPNTTHAKVGDIIAFKFYPPDHSVIRANFFHGCIPYERVGDNSVGFYSGVQYLNGISENGPVFNVLVNDTEPIFFYCGAPNSCKGKHMIGVINPNDTWTLDEHLKRVEEASFALTPDEPWPSEEEKPDDYNENYDKNQTTSASEPASSSADEEKADTDEDHGHHLSAGAIAGISIGSAAVLLLAGGLIYLFGRRGGQKSAWGNSRVSSFQPGMGGSFNNGGHGYAGTPMMTEQKALTPKMAEAWGGGPQTPGPGAINGYAAVPHTDGHGSPQLNGGFGPRSPPMSPQQGGYGGYSGTMISAVTSDNGTYANQGVTPHITPPPPTEAAGRPSGGPSPAPQPAPVELPTSNDPGNSPLPNYTPPSRQFSWAQGAESGYRPGKS